MAMIFVVYFVYFYEQNIIKNTLCFFQFVLMIRNHKKKELKHNDSDRQQLSNVLSTLTILQEPVWIVNASFYLVVQPNH
jgi:hypothetical protein